MACSSFTAYLYGLWPAATHGWIIDFQTVNAKSF
jgi:hypothetical protein